jgi:predicted PurR-regulated permease PerM
MSEIRSGSFSRPVLYAVLLLGGYLSYRILGPFIEALTWAALFAVLFRTTHVELARRIGPNGAALVTTLLVAIVIVTPAVLLISALAREAPQVTDYVKRSSQSAPGQIDRIWAALRGWSPLPMPEDPTDLITRGAQRALAFLAPRAGAVVVDALSLVGNLVAMLFALFFMLRDADALTAQLRDGLPFSPEENERLLCETRDLVIASVSTSLIVAIAQGAIGGAAFWLVGISAPVVWAVVIGFCSLVPGVGAALVWVPAAIVLLLSGEIGRGVALVLMGALGISMADNVLRPLLLSGRTSINGLVIFFGLLGGAAAFGLIGLVIGPIILVTTARVFRRFEFTTP